MLGRRLIRASVNIHYSTSHFVLHLNSSPYPVSYQFWPSSPNIDTCVVIQPEPRFNSRAALSPCFRRIRQLSANGTATTPSFLPARRFFTRTARISPRNALTKTCHKSTKAPAAPRPYTPHRRRYTLHRRRYTPHRRPTRRSPRTLAIPHNRPPATTASLPPTRMATIKSHRAIRSSSPTGRRSRAMRNRRACIHRVGIRRVGRVPIRLGGRRTIIRSSRDMRRTSAI